MAETWDIAIVGAGAAGLAAAVFAGEAARSARVVLLDGTKAIGAKILVSGGSRCNVTHDRIRVEDYNGSRNIVRNILAAFDEQATVKWFESMGVALKREETGKLFPVSDSARSVLNALLGRCRDLGVQILAQHRVHDVVPGAGEGTPFLLRHEQGELRARRLIMATGGRSLPKTGSDGEGWQIVRRLGHSVTETYPALVPLVLAGTFFHAELSGLSQVVTLSTFAQGKRIDQRSGDLLWTHFGISGPVVMDASRHWIVAQASGQPAEMQCSFLPGLSFEQAEQHLVRAATARPKISLLNVLTERLPHRLAEALIRHCGIEPATPMAQLAREVRRRLVHALVALPLPVVGDRGWNYAEVTAGGVPLSEIDYRTMESRKLPGLHLIGEMLDCDGRIGGFNFQWAWATGHIAGRVAARELRCAAD